MRISGRRRKTAVFIVLGVSLVVLAGAFNIGWIILNWREGMLLLFGVLLFPLIVAGLVLNTIFLVREVRRNEQHNAFINAVTHELKTPVASIRLYLETLRSRNPEPEQRDEFHRIMLADTDRLLASIDQILRAGQAAHPQRWIHRQPVDLEALVRDCIALVSARYGLAAGAIQFHAGVTDTRVAGDRDELRVAIANLIDNAVKYSGSSPGAAPVRVELHRFAPHELTLRIHDQGRGIAAAELKAIFKRFYRIPAAGVAGTGLGLFIVRSVVRRHGGRVRAESPGPGLGSTFVVQLPLFR